MEEIIKIVIKGSSGYGPGDMAYIDKLVLERNCISYEYSPLFETETNPKRKWKYTTTSPVFENIYKDITAKMPDIINRRMDASCTDIGGIEFLITFSDKTKWKNVFWIPGSVFKDCFLIIQKLIPGCETIPAVITI